MYDVSITNNYIYPLHIDEIANQPIAPNGGKAQYTKWGSNYVVVPAMGEINFIDIADKKLPQYTNPELPWTEKTWGGIARYRGVDAYFRYEGEGKVDLVVDQYGSISLHFEQGGMLIELDEMTVI